MTYQDLLDSKPFSLHGTEKANMLCSELAGLTQWHELRCKPYAKLRSVFFPAFEQDKCKSIADIPWLPVSLFKRQLLSSVPDSEVFRILVSSGTTNQNLSKIVLDKQTAERQAKALAHIMKAALGGERLPMIIVDSETQTLKPGNLSARSAGVLGFMNFGRDHFFALDDDLNLRKEALNQYLEKHQGKRIFVFGFTFMIWQHFYKNLKDAGIDLSKATILHGGGWKKLQQEKVDDAEFRDCLKEAFKTTDVRNFYGMVEQTGSIFLQSADGYLYTPNFAEVVIRRPGTWQVAEPGEEGLIQVLSLAPLSYPGYSLLTEDLGTAFGEGESPEGWFGTRFKVSGRVPKAELRGCSDVLAVNHETQQQLAI